MEIGEPIKKWEVVPLSEPIPATPEPAPSRAPVKEPAKVPEKVPA